ncbi:hypothetical protein J437_LFUL007181 [Ladona fulva]|uniref:Ig-like domain-containing protein n=1 Tax=Ladona fulva TaxID=123851 RepID=A0A8K0NZJ9_LADFU|nr:hypothetical protein J437_LFUL007181 [Ladona fulva]
MVRANCTAQRSYPPVNLTWMVNGKQVRGRHVRRYPLRRDEGNATTSTLGLEVEAGSSTFRRGRLTLRCQATLLSAYNASAELVIEEERPRLASVLGTRESSSAPASGPALASPASSSISIATASKYHTAFLMTIASVADCLLRLKANRRHLVDFNEKGIRKKERAVPECLEQGRKWVGKEFQWGDKTEV